MAEFRDILLNRRSVRAYTSDMINGDDITKILEAALLSPTSKNKHSWEFIIVEDKKILEKLSIAKPSGGTFIKDAAFAIVVLGNPLLTNAWIEDAAIAATNMQSQAEELGIGSCWVQIRERSYNNAMSSNEYLAELLDVPMPLEVECILSFGIPSSKPEPHRTDNLLWEKVHISKYRNQ